MNAVARIPPAQLPSQTPPHTWPLCPPPPSLFPPQQMGNAVSPQVAAALGRCLALAAAHESPPGRMLLSVPDLEYQQVRPLPPPLVPPWFYAICATVSCSTCFCGWGGYSRLKGARSAPAPAPRAHLLVLWWTKARDSVVRAV